MSNQPVNNHTHYHAHIYFDGYSLDAASAICEQAKKLFAVDVGKLHQKIVGPHPRWSCRIGFDHSQFDTLVPWLEQNRNELTILIHCISGNDLDDHTKYASWLGEPLTLDLSVFDTRHHSGT